MSLIINVDGLTSVIGAVIVSDGANLLCDNSTMRGNKAGNGAGIDASDQCFVALQRVAIANGVAEWGGGGISVARSSSVRNQHNAHFVF